MKAELNKIADEVMRKYHELPMDFAGHVKVGKGASGSETSKIDKFAEDAVIEHVKHEGIDLNILSEEIGYIDMGAKKTLVLDPIDGTLNCTHGIPFFSVSLAICTDSMSDCDHALVKNLYSGDTYYARRGGGATLNDHRIGVSRYKTDESIFIVYDGKDAGEETQTVRNLPSRIRTMGCASLEMCLVAQGAVDGHYMNCSNPQRMIRIIDIAASALILREAGGELCDLEGNKYDVSLSLDDRKNFLAYGDPVVKELVLRS
ncbi:MAG TPA: inositol monophosphatase family protein [Thermoplasmata archaeon]|nr:inositol monophosphatase family protein [Thermoplasmata archaeon]